MDEYYEKHPIAVKKQNTLCQKCHTNYEKLYPTDFADDRSDFRCMNCHDGNLVKKDGDIIWEENAKK